jgi:hypothetical protein
MMRRELLRWQLDGYPEFHRKRTNLWIHVFAVPAFVASFFSLVTHLAMMRWGGACISLGAMIVAFAVQGIGHKGEASPPIPFEGPGDAVTRIFAEQFITFWRFLLSGRWRAALHSSGHAPGG